MIEKKNILYIGDPYCIHNLKWISWFSAKNNCMIIGAVNDYSNRTEHTEKIHHQAGIRVFNEPLPEFSVKKFWRTRRGLKRLDKIVQDNKIDLVHIMYGTNIPWGYGIKKPMMLTTRGSDILIDLPRFFSGYNGSIWKNIYTKVTKKIQCVTSTSDQQAERFATLFPDFPKQAIHTIRTGVNVEEIKELGEKLRIERDPYRFLLARYLAPNYNNELILDAVSKLEKSVREKITLVLITPVKPDPNYVKTLLQKATETGCKVILEPEMSQHEMWAEYFKAGICLMTPLSDGTPNTALEAMSANCPLVLPPLPYDKGLFDGVTIRLSQYDSDELCKILQKHLAGEHMVNTEAAYDRALEQGNRAVMMTRLNELYKKLTRYQGEVVCTRCVLSTHDDPDIEFDEKGICNYCRTYDQDLPRVVLSGERGLQKWQNQVDLMKKAGQGKSYDCILGVSGGTDSTYLALKAKESGLRVLCIHLDNGWNSKEAASNIKNLVRKLGFDLYTHVINWEEFKDVQLSYFKAGVLDLDVPTDHAMLACLYQQAIKHKITYILSGHNFVTEAILPKNFNFDKGDAQNLINIHTKFGHVPLKTFPLFKQADKYKVNYYYKLVSFRPLNLIEYNKEAAKAEIIAKLGWKDYGSKHFENIFTRFYQGYILPRRFGIDKRKAHLATLICSGQMTRDEAHEELKKPPYNPEQFEIDKNFILNKFGWTEAEFEAYMTMPKIPHEEYGLEKPWSHYLGYQYLRKRK